MKNGRGRQHRRDYGWSEAQEELEEGVHPAVVAARIGEPVDFVVETAEQRGWAIVWKAPTAEQILDAHERADA